VTNATAVRGVRGQAANARISRPIGAEVASTWPVMMMSDICSVNGIRSQNPLPHASTTCGRLEVLPHAPAAATMNVASRAKMNASGTHRSVQAVSLSAIRAIGPGWLP
jgi:hypothetical protein